MSNRTTRRQRPSDGHHQRCGVCRRRLHEADLCRWIAGGPEDGLYGHAACIDGVVVHLVEVHGLIYCGDHQL